MDKIIFFATLVIFPFGQLFKIGIFNLFDILVVLLAIITFLKKPKYPSWYKYFIYFLIFSLFSLAVNYQLFEIKSLLYLVRFWAYSMIAVYVSKTDISRWLLAISIASATLGWLQYLIWPDLTFLKYLGWDDHLLRMVGTFLDPTYLGLILVLGIILASGHFPKIMYFLLISLAFTYSRSSYLVATLFLIYKKKYIGLLIFILVILFLPKNIGEGTNFLRTASGNNKLINYEETFEIFKKLPLTGVGFNNICSARQKYLGDTNTDSHACNGADSSILFLLATTGIVGTILFLSFVLRVTSSTHTTYYILLTTSFVVVFIHSLQANSMFYPHIMFWMFSLIGLASKVDRK